MTKQKLDQYCGRLTPAQIADGINAAQSNAQRLADDARTLFEANRYPTAASLAILSLEESGKVTILRELCLAQTDEEVRKCWKDYRSHTKKNVMAMIMQIIGNGGRHLSDFAPLYASDAEHPYLVDTVKQIGFYTDCLGEAHWSFPEDVIDKELARSLCFTAGFLSMHDRKVTAREIELWIEHLLPVKNKDTLAQRKALSSWWEAMQQEGIIPPGNNDMEKFVLGKNNNN